MKVAEFVESKVKNVVKRYGSEFKFKRYELNMMNERTGEFIKDSEGNEIEMCLKGLYHESAGYIQRTTADGAVTRTKKQPMILCLMSDLSNAGIKVNDIVVNEKTVYEVVGITDMQGLNVAADISLEVVDDGKSEI